MLTALSEADQQRFLAALGERLSAAYTPSKGRTLFEFTRRFFVARRQGAAASR